MAGVMGEGDEEEQLFQLKCNTCNKYFADDAKIDLHLKTNIPCVQAGGRCYYYKFCKFQASTAEEMKEHLKNDKSLHLEAMTLSIVRLDEDLEKKQDATVTKRAKGLIRDYVQPLETMLARLAMHANKVEEGAKWMERTNSERLANLAMVKAQAEDVGTLCREIEQLAVDTTAAGYYPDITMYDMLDQYDDVEESLERISAQMSQTATHFDGEILWKISDYFVKKENEMSPDTNVDYYESPPFYTLKRGYKLGVRAYLNGSGLSRNTHLSLYVYLVAGENDDLLPWPFTQMVTFTLYGPHKALEDYFYINPDAPYASKPNPNSRRVFGFRDFVSQAKVESPDYLINDTIFIKVRVRPKALPVGSPAPATEVPTPTQEEHAPILDQVTQSMGELEI